MAAENALHFHSWGNDFVVYNSAAGDTHLLGSIAAQVLLKLQQAPADAVNLAEEIASSLQREPDDELVLFIEQTLADFESFGIIEPL